jgi:hypothetical protein
MIGWLLGTVGLGGIGAAIAFIPGALPAVLSAISAAWDAIRRYPREAAIVGLLMACGWLWHMTGKRNDTIAARDATIATMTKASDANHAAQVAQVQAIEAKSKQIAKDSDNAHETHLADARSAADRYIAANRVRPSAAHISTPGQASGGTDPGVHESLPAGTVMVSEGDVQICTANTTYAIDAHNLAQAKIDAGLAK